MALPPIITEIIIKLVITSIFILLNAILLREIVTLFGIRDTTMTTALAIAVWIGGLLFIFSFISELSYIGWISALLIFLFIYLIKWYYEAPWKETLLIWEMWISILFYLAMLIYAFSLSRLSLVLWALIPFGLAIAFILFIKYHKNEMITHPLTIIVGFLVIKIVSIYVLSAFFPIL